MGFESMTSGLVYIRGVLDISVMGGFHVFYTYKLFLTLIALKLLDEAIQ